MKKKPTLKKFKTEDYVLLDDLSISADVVAFMTNMPVRNVTAYRHKTKYAESLRQASARFREKKRKENLAKFGKANGCYNYWTDEEIEYLLNSTETDDVIAQKLNRTTEAIQKKRERELLKRRT